MHVLNAPGIRVVARPDALDAAVWHDSDMWLWDEEGGPIIYRFAPDEAFGIVGTRGRVEVEDPDAIIEEETGFVSLLFEADEFREIIEPHVEWPIPVRTTRVDMRASGEGSLIVLMAHAGSVAGVPARVDLHESGEAGILVLRAHAHELMSRLGISAVLMSPPWPR